MNAPDYLSKQSFIWMAAGIIGLYVGCGTSSRKTHDRVKFEQYYVYGHKLYNRYCYSCHRKEGEGFMDMYPPLAQSDFMEKRFERVLCIIKNGIEGEIQVNGKTYNGVMKGVPHLTNLEIAEIATYIYNIGEHDRGLIDAKTVEEALKACP